MESLKFARARATAAIAAVAMLALAGCGSINAELATDGGDAAGGQCAGQPGSVC